MNYGAALQAYALQESIRKIGCQVEILDYHEQCAGMPNQHFSLFSRVYTKLKLLNSINYNISLLKCALYSSRCKKQLFSDFRKKYMRLSSKTLFSFNDLKNIESDYDGIIVGSDMVWTKIGQDMNVFFCNLHR